MSVLVALILQYGLVDFFRFLPVPVSVWKSKEMKLILFVGRKTLTNPKQTKPNYISRITDHTLVSSPMRLSSHAAVDEEFGSNNVQ